MDELAPIKDAIDNHRRAFPNHRRFPKKIWQQIIPLAPKYNTRILAKELGMDPNNLAKRIRALTNNPKKDAPDFVPIPARTRSKQVTLTLPHNIKLSIEL